LRVKNPAIGADMTTGGADRPNGAICGAAPLRLRTRKEFVAAARGVRRHASSFVLQVRPRGDAPENRDSAPARFGLTVAKKTVPLAVHRNRIRRRLREALRLGAALSGAPGHDYVLIARADALRTPFAQLREEIAVALSAPARDRRPKNRPSPR
jgi:ribonuclease P protein component